VALTKKMLTDAIERVAKQQARPMDRFILADKRQNDQYRDFMMIDDPFEDYCKFEISERPRAG
jgi:hypothetical protein